MLRTERESEMFSWVDGAAGQRVRKRLQRHMGKSCSWSYTTQSLGLLKCFTYFNTPIGYSFVNAGSKCGKVSEPTTYSNSQGENGRHYFMSYLFVFAVAIHCHVKTLLFVTKLLTFWRQNFFLILANPVYKMGIIQEPNTLELWNKLHFEEKKNGEYIPSLNYSVPIFVE